VIGIPLTFSIAHGISFGIMAWAVIAFLSGRTRSISRGMYLMAGLLAVGWMQALLG
jgi:AGZA family xanthine/uracil permease-like MFS transporter